MEVRIRTSIRHFIRYNLRAIILGILVVMTWGTYFMSQESAHGAAVIRIPISISDFENRAGLEANDRLMGGHVVDVDFNFVSKGKRPVRMGAGNSALIGIRYDKSKNGLIPAKAKINWAKALKVQWKHKLARPDVSPATRKWADKIVAKYENAPRDTKTAKAFIVQIDIAAKQMHRAIDYGKMCHDLKIDNCTAYYQVMGRIKGVNLAAYGMTELFPSHNGDLNYAMLDTILKSAGENYLDSIPAGGDSLLSKGFYQMTSLAIRRDSSGLLGGVTFIDNYAGMKLPGSVVRLKLSDTHKAAFALAAYNIAFIFRGMSDKDAYIFTHKCSIKGLTQLIAIGHHQPRGGVIAGKKWVHDGCIRPIQYYLNPHLKEYAFKTETNFNAIISRQR